MLTRQAMAGIAGAAMTLTATGHAQQPPPQFPEMTFFVTSVGGPQGANYGGLEGADRHCQTLAAKAGAGAKTWRAYLSTQAVGGATAVNARDRIGKGPWVNARGVQIAASVEDLHSANNKIAAETIVAETGRLIPSRLYTVNQHDILTGTQADGTAFPPDKDMTCGNWTKSGEGNAMVGHADRMGLRDDEASKSWNTSHPSRACDATSLVATGGAGLLYCFAEN
ncbi:MAG: lectin [Kaistia sp. SCN 65-12]|nr:MAG: lectin [Kaistia sp. SCN 65-12]